jgi:maltokinase
MIASTQLAPLIAPWLHTQRWFAGKGRPSTLTLGTLGILPGSAPAVTIWTAHVGYEDDTSELYQLPLVLHAEPVESLEHALLGSVDTDDGTRWVYDALHDKDVTAAWLVGIRDETVSGTLQFHRTSAASEIPVEQPSLVLTAEQSNTSLIFSDVAILKVFRRLQPGVNPDIEIHEALSALGAVHVPRLLGAVTADLGEQR